MSVKPFPSVRVHEVEELDPEKVWLVQDIWAREGVGIIGGAPKSGKTFLGLDLALSVASGTPCLGKFPVHDAGTVLLYLGEDKAPRVKERLLLGCKHRGLDLTALPIHLITEYGMKLHTEDHQKRLRETSRQVQPRLLVLDPLIRVAFIEENNAEAVARFTDTLREIQEEFHTAVVLVHHARKAEADRGGVALRGSSALHGWGDSNLYLQHRSDKPLTSRLDFEQRYEAAHRPIGVRLVEDEPEHLETFELPQGDEDTGQRVRSNLSREKILQALQESPEPLSDNALWNEVKPGSKTVMRKILATLLNDGLVQEKAGRWTAVGR